MKDTVSQQIIKILKQFTILNNKHFLIGLKVTIRPEPYFLYM